MKMTLPPSMEFFARPRVNFGQNSTRYVDILPRTTRTGSSENVEFLVPGNSKEFIDFSRSHLYVKAQIVKEDGTPFKYVTTPNAPHVHEPASPDNDYAVPIDNFLHSMWKSVNVQVGDTMVSSSGTLYAFHAYIETMLTTDKGDVDRLMQNQLQQLDTGHPVKEAKPTQHVQDEMNTGAKNRFYKTSLGRVFEMQGPLMTDIWDADRLLLNGTEMYVTLIPNFEAFRLCVWPDKLVGKVKTEIHEIYLRICYVDLSNKALEGVGYALKMLPAQYPHKKTVMNVVALQQGRMDHVVPDIFNGHLPIRVAMVMVRTTAYNGHAKMNPFRFMHNKLKAAAFYIDDCSIPHKPYRLNFTDPLHPDYLHAVVNMQ